MTNVDTLKILAFLLLKLHPPQIPKNIRNLGTWFLRKVPESEEGLTRKSRLNASTRYMRLPQLSTNEDVSNVGFVTINEGVSKMKMISTMKMTSKI